MNQLKPKRFSLFFSLKKKVKIKSIAEGYIFEKFLLSAIGLVLGWLLWLHPVYASDHQDAPKILQTPVVDISDLFAFTTTDRGDHLVTIMNVFPLATESAWFAKDFEYSIVVHPATISGTGAKAGFNIAEDEFRFSCSFQEPQTQQGSQVLTQTGTCTGPNPLSVPVVVNDEKGAQISGMRVFAGRRLDTFFLDFANIAKGKLGTDTVGKNSLQNKNVLSIAIETDIKQVFGTDKGSLLAVVGEVNSISKPVFQVDRQGRSEMTNITLSFQDFDRVNQKLDVRDLYNQENTFKPSPDYQETFRARFNANLGFWDKFDGQIDWKPLADGQHPLTNLLMKDILVIDTAKPCTEDGFFEIEKAMLADSPYQTCGGRKPNHDTVDSLLTLYINGGKGSRIKDGVDQPTQLATDTFPYLPPPHVTSDS